MTGYGWWGDRPPPPEGRIWPVPSPIEADPRPLTDEPLSIDLLNTRWIDAEGPHDLLDSVQWAAH